MKLTIEQKKDILKKIDDLNEKLQEELETESATDGQHGSYGVIVTLPDFEEDIIEILKIAGIDTDLDTSLSMEYIIKEYNGLDLDNLIELKEVDSRLWDSGETKYKYIETVYEYMNTGVLHKFTLQQSADGQVDLNIEYNGIVTKKETVATVYE